VSNTLVPGMCLIMSMIVSRFIIYMVTGLPASDVQAMNDNICRLVISRVPTTDLRRCRIFLVVPSN
jgi:hypothetical protein